MVNFLFVIIILLIVVIVIQYMSRRRSKAAVTDISTKMDEIIRLETAEKVLLPTGEQELQQLLVQINRLLDHNQKLSADYIKAKDSLRKLIANMSHDLKTPLTVILGYVEKLRYADHLTDEDRHVLMGRLHDKVWSLTGLLNQFFDLVKLESDDYVVPLSKISLNEICKKNILDFYELLLEKKLQVEVAIPERPIYILGNEDALNRVISNLISNSIRYGSDGGLFGLTLQEQDGTVSLEVWDKGKGIGEHDQAKVFERLYTLDDARNPQFQGSGLGLSISKRLTEAMKGTIHVSSRPYERTSFTCHFKHITY
ncbi:sensor histidine kinase KdpD [Paenibacillus sp. PDC88]|uniref:sensor histidine kinase n=1 Tax=Paenibacillus sp. PDC88 TaxID=1884375 RepID=UPI000895C3FF|nr:sensor histidine kinase [Paenibacillus sp. PDC88]SDX68046.1 Signal transduction histidine kinase [Paenibacillus sp. PDC88]